MSEDTWFRTMLDIDVGAPPLPKQETRLGFMRRYAEDSWKRLAAVRTKDESWWEGETVFFGIRRSRLGSDATDQPTAHHRGQQLGLLRMLGRELYSNYGPTANTGGLMQNHAATIYAYPNLKALLDGEAVGRRKAVLPGVGSIPVSERPENG